MASVAHDTGVQHPLHHDRLTQEPALLRRKSTQFSEKKLSQVSNLHNTLSRSGPTPQHRRHNHSNSSNQYHRVNLLSSTWWAVMVLASLQLLVNAIQVKAFKSDSHLSDLRPKVIITPDEQNVQSFHGNRSHPDHFRLLQTDGDFILVGARNIVFNISTLDLTEDYDSRIVWSSTQKDSTMCFNKGKSEAECQNYIRVLVRKAQGEFLVCGTNAYKPLCRDYSLSVNGSVSFEESNGIGKCPYGPRHNSTFVYADGELYSGTVADFQGTIPLIFREPLKTNHNDLKQLNAPDFVHSFEYKDFVFFFLRETAVEYMNCGKTVYSRVARVCKSDKGGGLATYQTLWTSFFKSRLNCSVPGEFPFYFDEIHSTSDVVDGIYAGSSESLVYAIFTTPQNAIPGSAICVFSMKDIQASFDGYFKNQETINSNWLPISNNKVPEPRPGSCVENSQSLPIENMNFARNHPLMDQAVPSFYGKPLLTVASYEGHRLHKITVDPQVPLRDAGGAVDVLFIATVDGVILKTINSMSAHSNEQVKPVIIEEIRLFNGSTRIANLQLARQTTGDTKLVVITDDTVTAIPLHRCNKAQSCSECVGLQDPYCAWFEGAGQCGPAHSNLQEPVFQNVSSGVHYQCPKNGENNLHPPMEPQQQSTPVTESAPLSPSCPPPVECTPCKCVDNTYPPPLSSAGTKQSPAWKAGRGGAGRGPEQETLLEQQGGVEGQQLLPGDVVDATAPHLLPPLLSPGHNHISTALPSHRSTHGFAYNTPPQLNRHGRGRGLVIVPGEEGDVLYGPVEEHPIVATAGPVIGASPAEGAPIYSAETLAIAVTTACVAALVIGFILGFLFSRKCRGDEDSNTPYLNSKFNKCDNLMASAESNMYSSNTKNNLVINYNTKNINSSKANATTTDLKPAKCAYI